MFIPSKNCFFFIFKKFFPTQIKKFWEVKKLKFFPFFSFFLLPFQGSPQSFFFLKPSQKVKIKKNLCFFLVFRSFAFLFRVKKIVCVFVKLFGIKKWAKKKSQAVKFVGRFEIKKNLCARKIYVKKMKKMNKKNLCVQIQGELIKRNPFLMIMMMKMKIFFELTFIRPFLRIFWRLLGWKLTKISLFYIKML